MARKLVVDDLADDEMLSGTVRSTKDVLMSADGSRVRSGAWWKGRAKLQELTKQTPAAQKKRRELFKRMNTDAGEGDNTVTLEEAIVAVQKMWPEFDNLDSIKMAYEAADRDGSGGITVKEARLFIKYQLFYDDCWDIFQAMDTNADGTLSESEFISNLDLLDVDLSNPEAVYLTMDRDGDGTVDLREFTVWLAQIKFKKEAKSLGDAERAFAKGSSSGTAAVLDAVFSDTLKARKIQPHYIAILLDNDINDFSILKQCTVHDFTDLGIKLGAY